MNTNMNSINPEVIKLQDAIGNALSDIKNKSEDKRIYLLLFLSISLLKDQLLKNFRNYIVHAKENINVKDLIKNKGSKRSNIYSSILENIQAHVLKLYEVIWIYNHLQTVNPEKIKNVEYILIFENLLTQLYGGGKRGNQYSILPKEIIELVYFLDNRREKIVYNPYSGFGDLSFHDTVKYFYGEEDNEYSYTVHLIRVLIHNCEDKIILSNDIPIYKSKLSDTKYDLIFSFPPINRRIKRSFYHEIFNYDFNNLIKHEPNTHEQLFFNDAIQRLNPGGKIISMVSQSFLGEQGRTKNIFKSWITDEYLETIIALPNLNHQLYTSVQLYIIVLSALKNRSGEVRYIDARSMYAGDEFRIKQLNIELLKKQIIENSENKTLKYVSQNEIIENEYNLCVNNYFYKKYDGKELGEICTEIKNTKQGLPGEVGRLVKISNLKNDKKNFVLTSTDIEQREITSSNYRKISESCLLIALIGKKIKPTYFEFREEPIYIFPNIMALRIDKLAVDINYLINELYQENVFEQLSNIASGSAISYYKKESLLKIIVDVDRTLAEQKKIIEKIEYSDESNQVALEDVKIQIDNLKKQFYEDVKNKEHNILQFLSASQSAASLIEYIISNQEEISNEIREKINRQINSLKKSLTSASYNIRRLSEKLVFDIKEKVDINQIINEAISQGMINNNHFSIDYTFNKDSFYIPIEKGIDPVYIDPIAYISRNDFFILYNNLLENAVNHGFTESDKKYQFKIDLYCMNENIFSEYLTIVFSNNGKPFPKGMSESYCIRGEKAGETANEGIGTWKVCQIVKDHFKGEIKVIDNPLDEYPVRIEIKLPIIGWSDEK